jgi:hypothetical protein
VSETTVKMRPVVDWSAALWAGVVSGIVFLLANLLLTGLTLGSPWIVLRVLASIVLGSGVLPPPATFNLGIAVVALLVNTVLSILFAGIIALIIHRWGLIVGLLGGAILGLALYAINFYTFSLFFPWFFPFRSWMMVVSHLIFGAAAGGTYELLEVEEFVPVEAES